MKEVIWKTTQKVFFKHMDIKKVDVERDLLCVLFIFFLDDNSAEVFEECSHIPA